MNTPKPPKPVKNPIRIIYQPIAGRAKTLRRNIGADGTITINDGQHTIGEGSTGIWKGKVPWCRINQNRVAALPWFGEASTPTPQFFNEAVNNHYAREAIEGLEKIDAKQEKGTMTYVLLGGLIVVVLAMSFWILKDISSLHDSLAFYVAHQAAPTASGAGVVDTSTMHTTQAPTHA